MALQETIIYKKTADFDVERDPVLLKDEWLSKGLEVEHWDRDPLDWRCRNQGVDVPPFAIPYSSYHIWRPLKLGFGGLKQPDVLFISYEPPEGRLDGFISSAPELAELLSKVNELAFHPEADSLGQRRPTYHAIKHCYSILLHATTKSKILCTPADIYSDRNGDIRVSWKRGDREIELICPSDETERPYIYFSDPGDFGTEENATVESLLGRIQWLFTDQANAAA